MYAESPWMSSARVMVFLGVEAQPEPRSKGLGLCSPDLPIDRHCSNVWHLVSGGQRECGRRWVV